MKLGAAMTLVLALTGGLALTAWANDQPCGEGCGLQMKACVKTARTGMLSCKMNCRTGSDPNGIGSCMRTCKTTFRSHQGDCRQGIQGCLGSCQGNEPNAPSGSSGCVAQCGENLGMCAQGVVSAAKTCLAGCRTASDRLSCLEGCAAQAEQGAAGCASGFASCLSGCGVTPPPMPCLLSGPACGGACPEGLSCGASRPGSPVPCVCHPVSSPSGAFVN